MRTRLVVVSLILLSFLLLAARKTDTPSTLLGADVPGLVTEVSVAPVTKDPIQLLGRVLPGMYRCRALVHVEPGSRRVWGAPEIVLSPGESASSVSRLGDLELRFAASISAKADKARTSVTVTRGDQIVGNHTSTVWLAKQDDDAIAPVPEK